MNGLMYAGSAIFTVVYSSVTIYNAIFAHIFLQKRLNIMQWVGVLIVMIGLALTSLGTQNEGKDVFFGIILILIGSMIHSGTYIMSEISLVHAEYPIAPQLLCSLLGSIELVGIIGWQIYYTLPRYQEKFLDEISIHNGDVSDILISYVLLSICSMVHSLCFFILLGTMGSTSTGITKAGQSAAVFVSSHYVFCATQKSQCFTPLKGISLAVVLCGVLLYSTSHKPASTHSYTEINDIDNDHLIQKPQDTNGVFKLVEIDTNVTTKMVELTRYQVNEIP
eukprot:CAMPEP_0170063822 /NCGR_PEP_ID=MMETSP0019_2-20121128/4546_1 /TAXON_ID=98059 /ORGANISM="Dinobryon sp., Strain UTEXLB2267" /LENGTH=278 /DNA_ID=CAMNT_0010270349 /DNA_START=176 /DNA_END=1012 /DNA_ORIENTATION=-